MRVLHLTTHLNIGGITTYILKLVRLFHENGVETYVVSSGGECTPEFKKRGVRIFELPIRTKSILHPKLYLNLPKLQRIVEENKIDVIHAHTRITQVMAYFLQRRCKIPVVTTCHGFYKRRLGRLLLPAWGERVIAISQAVADSLKKDFSVSDARIRVVNNGVDIREIDEAVGRIDFARAKTAFGFGANDPVIGSVARLVQDKGHEYLILAMELLRRKYPSVRLLIVGDGKYRGHLEKMVRERGLQAHIRFTGNIQDVTPALAAMDIFSLPATWREGFGLSIVEAMVCRIPVIVSNIWALNTLIQNEVTGILIEPKRVEPLAESLAELFGDPEKRKRIGERGRRMVQDLFSIERMAHEILSVYGEVIPSQPAPASPIRNP